MPRTNLEREAHALGFPATLFGFTPNEASYWREPGLPWLPTDWVSHPPQLRNGLPGVWCPCEFAGQSMAPRFPKGTTVNLAPVLHRANLLVGRVYVYAYSDEQTGQQAYQAGRLERVGGNCLWARADHDPATRLCWLLREDPAQECWDVYEVTHYLHYPAQ